MKKIIALLLALVMVFALVACGGTKAPEADTGANTNTDAESGESIEGAAGEDAAAGDAEAEMPEEVVVMTHDEFIAAELDTQVVVETYVQAKQGWWEKDGVGVATFYTQAEDGAYFIYDMPCSQEDYDKMVAGTKIRVTGYKAEWAGEVEIMDATYEILDGNYVATAFDVTSLLNEDTLIDHQNEFVAFTNMRIEPSVDAEGNEVAFLYNWDGSGQAGNDLYFNASYEGATYTFTVESYLTGDGTDVYEAVEALEIGSLVNMEGFLYWYEGVNPHITSVAINPKFAPVDEATEAGVYDYLQGEWSYDDTSLGAHFDVTFDGYNFYVTSTIAGQSISNEGTYQIGAEAILVTYTNGQMAYMDYEWDGSVVTLYYLTGLV